MQITRRAALLGLGASWALCDGTLGAPALALAAAPTDKRFVVVILRGALDGMAAVVPYGDADLASWRQGLIPPPPGQDRGLLDLGGFFGLHPALAGLHGFYQAGEMLPVHAVAGPYRSRSHFEAQDYLELGAEHGMTSGWLNRAVGTLNGGHPAANAAMAVGVQVPLLLRGPAEVGNYSPEIGQHPSPDLYARIAALTAADGLIGPAIAQGLQERGFAQSVLNGAPDAGPARGKGSFPQLAGAAGHLLAAPDGPRIAALELGGWDTHAGQAGRLNGPLRQLDAGLVALRQGLGEYWRDTAVLVMTEFGRTVRINGTAGTDHGTAGVAFVLGGAVLGGKVGGIWPGLRRSQLFENRDLAPTTDLRAVAKGLLGAHLGLDDAALNRVFPGSGAVSPMAGLIRV